MNRQSKIVSASPRDYTYRREMTLEERLAEERILFLWGEIGPATAGSLIMRLLEMSAKHGGREISLYINSPGGSVDDTLAIYDTMSFLACDISTYCVGQAASGGAILLMAGTKGRRFILPNAKVMLHQPSGGIGGQAEDIRIQAEEILRDKDRLNRIISDHTGRDVKQIAEDIERDCFMTADEALEYGVVDEVLHPEKAKAKDQADKEKKKKKKD